MNKIFYSLMLSCTIIFFMSACQSSKTATHSVVLKLSKTGNAPPGKDAAYVAKKTDADSLADSLHKVINLCTSSQHCGPDDDYCSEACVDIIMHCHEIDVNMFNRLIADGNEKSKPFKRRQIRKILSATQCSNQKIKCHRYQHPDGTYYYGIIPVAKNEQAPPNDEESDTYYSKPLLQGIYNKKVRFRSIILYNAIATADHRAVIPIKVFYKNKEVKYYDLSNDFP